MFKCNSSSPYKVSLFQGVPLVLRWCSVGVPVGVPLFCHYSGVFCCSAAVPCFVVPCSGVPGFIVCPISATPSDSGMLRISDSRIFLWVFSEHTKWPRNNSSLI